MGYGRYKFYSNDPNSMIQNAIVYRREQESHERFPNPCNTPVLGISPVKKFVDRFLKENPNISMKLQTMPVSIN